MMPPLTILEGLRMVGGNKLHHQTVVGTKRVNFQAVFVGWPASKTDRIWRIGPLHADVAHVQITCDTICMVLPTGKTER